MDAHLLSSTESSAWLGIINKNHFHHKTLFMPLKRSLAKGFSNNERHI